MRCEDLETICTLCSRRQTCFIAGLVHTDSGVYGAALYTIGFSSSSMSPFFFFGIANYNIGCLADPLIAEAFGKKSAVDV